MYFAINGDFEAANEIEKSNIGNKTIENFQPKPVCIGYYKKSEMIDILQSGFSESPLGYKNFDWFVDEIIKLDSQMNFFHKNTKREILGSEKYELKFRIKNISRFCEKENSSDRIRDVCHLTVNYRGPAH